MYLNLIQIAESFGVSEKVVEGWIRDEGLPHTPDRGRLLFDRAQVAQWAATRGLAAQAGFLAPETPALATQLASSDRCCGRAASGAMCRRPDVPDVFARIVTALPGATPPVRQLLAQRLRAQGGVTMAPVGGGFALPHPSARITLGRDSGTVALLLLRDALPLAEPPPDGVPVTRLFFFIAPSPRAHLDLLGRLSRCLVARAAARTGRQGRDGRGDFPGGGRGGCGGGERRQTGGEAMTPGPLLLLASWRLAAGIVVGRAAVAHLAGPDRDRATVAGLSAALLVLLGAADWEWRSGFLLGGEAAASAARWRERAVSRAVVRGGRRRGGVCPRVLVGRSITRPPRRAVGRGGARCCLSMGLVLMASNGLHFLHRVGAVRASAPIS